MSLYLLWIVYYIPERTRLTIWERTAKEEHAGAELCQSQGGCVVGGWTETKLMLISTQVEVVVEAGVELGNYWKKGLMPDSNSISQIHYGLPLNRKQFGPNLLILKYFWIYISWIKRIVSSI